MLDYKEIPNRILQHAWGHAPLGESYHEGFWIFKDRKMVVIHQDVPREQVPWHLHVVAFPRREDFHHFKTAAAGVLKGGPAHYNPGAVGTVVIDHWSPRFRPFMSEAQAHYKREGNPRLKVPEAGLPRRVERRYSGWRARAIRQALAYMQRRGEPVTIQAPVYLDMIETFRTGVPVEAPHVADEIRKACAGLAWASGLAPAS